MKASNLISLAASILLIVVSFAGVLSALDKGDIILIIFYSALGGLGIVYTAEEVTELMNTNKKGDKDA